MSFPQTYLNLLVQKNVVSFQIITPLEVRVHVIQISYFFFLFSISFRNSFNPFNNSGTLKKQIFTLKPIILTQFKTFPNSFRCLLEYNFSMVHAEILIKTITQLDCIIY